MDEFTPFAELFADYDQGESVEKTTRVNKSTSPLKPFHQTDGWFNAESNPHKFDVAELHYFRGNYAAWRGHAADAIRVGIIIIRSHTVPSAFSSFQHFLEYSRHGGVQKFNEDQLIRLMLKERIELDKLPALFASVKGELRTHGEQMQYWDLVLDYAGVCPQAVSLACRLRILICMCSSLDYSRLWLRFIELPLPEGCNLKVGARCRAVNLMRREARNAKGFVRDSLSKKADSLEASIREEFPSELIEEAMLRCCWDLTRSEGLQTQPIVAVEEQPQKPPHLSRAELPKKAIGEEGHMVTEFIEEKYTWCFIDGVGESLRQAILNSHELF